MLDAGLKSKTVARRLDRGRWQQLHRGVYAVFTGPPGRETWLWALVRAAMAVRKKMRWRAELADVLAVAGDGVHSVLEYRYLRDIERAHGLPPSRRQVRVVIDGRVVYRDAYYEKYRVAIELDGRAPHPKPCSPRCPVGRTASRAV